MNIVSTTGAFAQTLLAKIFLLGANLATGVIVARSLAPVGRGEQAAMAMWPGLLTGLFSLGLGLAVTYTCRRAPERESQLLSASILISLACGLIAMALGYIFIPSWLSKYDGSVITFARWMLLIVPFTMVTYVLQAIHEVHGDFTTSNLSKSLPQLVSVIVLGTLALTHHLTPFTSTAAYLVPWTLVPPILAWRVRELIVPQLREFRIAAKQLLSYGIRSYIIDILGTLSGQVDQVLVVGLLSPSALGLYTVALSVSRVLSVFHASLLTVLFPKASALEQDDVIRLTGRAVRISSFIATLASISLIVILPFIMVRLYGGAFKGVVPVARILCVEIVISGATSILCQAFMATGRPGTIAVLQVIGLLLTVPFMLVLIPHLGLSGAALALLLSSCCRLALVLGCYPALLKARIPNLLITPDDFRFLVGRLRRRFAR
jgi:O-antigen/teichoic acid export membrane protein